MKESIRELFEYRHLLFMLTWKEIRIRYKQTIMGFFWALLMPMLIVAAGVLIRQAFALVSDQAVNLQDVASICVKALPWAFFVGAIRFATSSLTGNSNLVTKIYFPREVFPVSAVLANLFDFAVASVVVVVVLILARTGLDAHILWLPLLLVLLVFLTLGLGMLLACGNLFFRDVKYIVEVLLTFGIFFTPVFYEAKMLGKWAPVILLNPLAPLLEAMNDVIVLHRPPDYGWLAYSASWAVLGFLIAWRVFERAESAFAENI
jgi:ABC-type polysaccharide/polyol phosphate export permease